MCQYAELPDDNHPAETCEQCAELRETFPEVAPSVERTAFENWAESRYQGGPLPLQKMLHNKGYYRNSHTQKAWDGWFARAEIAKRDARIAELKNKFHRRSSHADRK